MFLKVFKHKCIGIVEYLEKNTSQKKVLKLKFLDEEILKVYTDKGIGKMLKKIQVRKKCWIYEILKSRICKCLHTDTGIGKLLKKNYNSEKSVEFLKSKN